MQKKKKKKKKKMMMMMISGRLSVIRRMTDDSLK
jgi:hypothetical protein